MADLLGLLELHEEPGTDRTAISSSRVLHLTALAICKAKFCGRISPGELLQGNFSKGSCPRELLEENFLDKVFEESF